MQQGYSIKAKIEERSEIPKEILQLGMSVY